MTLVAINESEVRLRFSTCGSKDGFCFCFKRLFCYFSLCTCVTYAFEFRMAVDSESPLNCEELPDQY